MAPAWPRDHSQKCVRSPSTQEEGICEKKKKKKETEERCDELKAALTHLKSICVVIVEIISRILACSGVLIT